MSTLRQAAQQALDVLLTTQAINAPSGQIPEAIAVLRAALTQPEPEPAIYPDEAREMGLEEVALYTHPPRFEWQGLRKEEILRHASPLLISWQQIEDNARVAAAAPDLLQALKEIHVRLTDHPAYVELTEDLENDIGGDTAELSYLARVARTAIAKAEGDA